MGLWAVALSELSIRSGAVFVVTRLCSRLGTRRTASETKEAFIYQTTQKQQPF